MSDSANARNARNAAGEAAEARGSWFSAAVYDPMLWLGERAGMAERRARLLESASGAVLEIGAGTGLNLENYPRDLDRLVLTEPEEHMAGRLARRASRMRREAEVVRASADALPFEDQSFDTVVSTMVLCTVPDPGASLREVMRVLRPSGTFLFCEHVRSESERLAGWQDRLRGPWAAFADGCRCNQSTLELLEEAGFEVRVDERARWRRMPPLVRPLVAGRAVPGPR